VPTIDDARSWYSEVDPVHGFDHVLRVRRTSEWLGRRLGADLEVLNAAALLHDVAGAHPGGEESRSTHELSSAEFAKDVLRQEGWPEDKIDNVVHCIRSHRYRSLETPETLEARILFDADKLDVIGAFGVARTIGFAVQAGEPVFAHPSAQFIATGEGESGESHSAYHEYLFKLRHVIDTIRTDEARRLARHRLKLMTQFFEQLKIEADGLDHAPLP
jgi:uncharacterized protein